MRVWDIAIVVLCTVALGIASLFREVSWFFWAGIVGGAVSWEITKFRLRRNAATFANARR